MSGLRFLLVAVAARDRVYVCDAGDGRNVALVEDATDRGPEPAGRPLTFEVLVGLVAVVEVIGDGREDR